MKMGGYLLGRTHVCARACARTHTRVSNIQITLPSSQSLRKVFVCRDNLRLTKLPPPSQIYYKPSQHKKHLGEIPPSVLPRSVSPFGSSPAQIICGGQPPERALVNLVFYKVDEVYKSTTRFTCRRRPPVLKTSTDNPVSRNRSAEAPGTSNQTVMSALHAQFYIAPESMLSTAGATYPPRIST